MGIQSDQYGLMRSRPADRCIGVVAACLLPRFGGLALFGVALLGLPFNAYHLAQFEALNRELGKLCSQPPPQAHNVCRLHARLVSSL
jgi:hypothetical protein